MYEELLRKSGSPFKLPKDIKFQRDPTHKNQWWFWNSKGQDRKTEKGQFVNKHGKFGQDYRRNSTNKHFIRPEYNRLGTMATQRAFGDHGKVDSFGKFKQKSTHRFD